MSLAGWLLPLQNQQVIFILQDLIVLTLNLPNKDVLDALVFIVMCCVFAGFNVVAAGNRQLHQQAVDCLEWE